PPPTLSPTPAGVTFGSPMERKDLEALVRRLVSEVVDRLEKAGPTPTAARREEPNPLGPPPAAATTAAPLPAAGGPVEATCGVGPTGPGLAPAACLVPAAGAAPAAALAPTATAPAPAAPAAAPEPVAAPRDTRVVLGADHGGFQLKRTLVERLHALGYPVTDVGTHGPEAVDYPDFARQVAEQVASGAAHRGVVIDGAGIGSAMVANKVRGVRAAVCHDLKTVLNSREHNDANVLSLGSGVVSPELAAEMVETWLRTPFAGGRHARRVDKIKAMDERR
ncbi:MAG TPA: ribose 5-phosphate isomerase B, partial [Candidatus Saccharimonadales bacterium]|nr:ribose 5-phosphate isomerase B [Candidatus Saccharimonadales bacterium]